ncbi:MAG: SRPBCC family protein [Bryobacterales bacterium]|nr:SRPBCC family protein [Bryobacterales bacterium]
MLKISLLVIVVLLAILAGVIEMQPPEYQVTRSATIQAPANVVFEQINDFHKWEAWSPWGKLDPAMKTTYTGPAAGTGASYAWVGNSDVGEGRMTILESRPAEFVRIRLEFIEPFASVANTEFSVKPEGNGVAVTWLMSGEKNFLSKAMCMVQSMDTMIGPDFERGLKQLKSAAEGAAK